MSFGKDFRKALMIYLKNLWKDIGKDFLNFFRLENLNYVEAGDSRH